MKKKIYIILLFLIIFMIALTTKSLGYFEIDNFQINCYVQENGDMKIEENITYRTNEYRNGVIRDIELKNEINTTNSANGFWLESVKVNGVEYIETYSASNGNNGVYQYSKSGNKHSLKVYTPFNKTGKTVTYTYLLEDVIVKYQDTAELYWNFIGSKWDTNINNVDINIILPEEAKKGAIYVYGHGSDDGTFKKTGNYISLNAKNIKAYQAIDARILFSNAAVPYATKNLNKAVLEKYIDQEEGLTKNREQKEILFGLNINQIAIGLSIIIVLAGILIYVKYTKKAKIEKQKYIREIPFDLEPELLQTVYYRKVCNDAFWITFLNLVKLGMYRIDKTVNEVGKETQKIVFVRDIDNLQPHQIQVVLKINGYMTNGEVDLLKLKSKLKNSNGSGYRSFKDRLLRRKESLFGETKKVPTSVKTILDISMVLLIIFIAIISSMLAEEKEIAIGIVIFLGMTTFIYTLIFQKIEFNAFTVIFLIFHCGMFQIGNIAMLTTAGTAALYIPYVLLFVLIQIIDRIVIYSKEELQLKEQIAGLRRFIKDYSMLEEKGIEHITLWEDYLILAIALKLNNKTINYFYDYCKENINDDFGKSLNYIGTYSVMHNSFSTTFNSYQKAYTSYTSKSSSSSYSGSSGGFSGGSSSGGGGRRRWRRKLLLEILGTGFKISKLWINYSQLQKLYTFWKF